jgi:hypothetical protein
VVVVWLLSVDTVEHLLETFGNSVWIKNRFSQFLPNSACSRPLRSLRSLTATDAPAVRLHVNLTEQICDRESTFCEERSLPWIVETI